MPVGEGPRQPVSSCGGQCRARRVLRPHCTFREPRDKDSAHCGEGKEQNAVRIGR